MQNNVFQLPSETKIAHAHLKVSNLDKAVTFYSILIGLQEAGTIDGSAALSADGKPPYSLILSEIADAQIQDRSSPGLFHTAIRFPTRKGLAQALSRLRRYQWPLQGASHHGVSEAIYLPDQDGNGVEIYADLPKETWPVNNDQVDMVTNPLDIPNLLAEVEGETIPAEAELGTDIGHIHLQVSGVDKAETFYHQVVGMDIMQRMEPSALFLAAGGYHHHIGANTWNSAGGGPAQEDQVGLKSFGVHIPDSATWFNILDRIKKHNYPILSMSNYGYSLAFSTQDLDGIQVEFLVDSSELSNEELDTLKKEELSNFS